MSGPYVAAIGSGPPLALLHGWSLDGGVFAALAPALAARFRVCTVDLPGHGRSAAVDASTLDGIVDAVAGALAAERAPLTLVGWSFGGQIALRWAARDPARISRLALVCTSPRYVAADDWPHAMAAETLDRFAGDLLGSPARTLSRFLALQVQGGEGARAALEFLRRAGRGVEVHAAGLSAALAVLRRADLRADAASVRAATLVIAGERDTIAPPGAGAWLARAIAGARFESVAGAAHAPFVSHPAVFVPALAGFVDGR
ncbi:MAG: alpha/beta fold hydrolase [Burkholderiales bacterium]